MISIIFGKTKPINYIIVFAFLLIFYWGVHFFLFDRVYSPEGLLQKALVLGVLLFSIFLVNFIVKRNRITGPNSFAILFYALLTVVFPETLLDSNAIWSSFFLLLATRRLISMRSERETKFKIFDATIWVLVSSLFYDWAILYIVLVFGSIAFYKPENFRNWIVPLAGLFTVYLITKSILILMGNEDFLLEHYQFRLSPDLAYFSNWGNSAKLVLFALVTTLTGIMAFIKLGKSNFGRAITMRLIVLSFVIGAVVNLFKLSDNVYPVMLVFFPAVVFMTKYVESIRRAHLKEIALVAAIAVPFLVLLTGIAFQ